MGKMNLGNLGQMPFSIKDVQIEGDDAVMIVNVGRPPSYVANAKIMIFPKDIQIKFIWPLLKWILLKVIKTWLKK